MLLQVLWALERLPAEVALMRLEWDMDADVRGDVVAFHGGRAAGTPLAGKVEVVCALAPDMAFADVVLVMRVSRVYMIIISVVILVT